MRIYRSSSLGLLLVIVTTATFAGPQEQQFRAGVDVVRLTFAVVDKAGVPITGLESDDLEVRIDGKPRALVSLAQVSHEAPGPSTAAAMTPSVGGASHRDPVQNEHEGRRIFIVFAHDSVQTTNQRPVVEALRRLVQALGPFDQVELTTLPEGKTEVPLTAAHERLEDGFNHLMGHANVEQSPMMLGRGLRALTRYFDDLAVLPGPKVVIFISEGILSAAGSLTLSRSGPSSSIPSYELTAEADFLAAGKSAARAHVSTYIIQPGAFPGSPAFRSTADPRRADWGRDGLEDLAGATGGESFRISGRADSVVARILSESASYYAAGVGLEERDLDGKEHTVVVTARRPNVIVRGGRTFYTSPSARRP